jgi:hypothetical protein
MQQSKHLDAYRKKRMVQNECLMTGRSIVMASFATHELFGIGHVREKQ